MAPIMYPTRGIGASTQARIGYVIIITTDTENIMKKAILKIIIIKSRKIINLSKYYIFTNIMFLRLTTGAAHLLILSLFVIANSPNHSEARAPQASTYTRRCLGFKKFIGLKRQEFFSNYMV